MQILKNIIVDSDGKVYIDSSLGDVSLSEKAIAPFSSCLLKDSERSSLIEYELVPEKIISAITSGMSLEEILGIFERFSITPIPLNVFSDLKHAEQSSGVVISGSVQNGFQVRSKNWNLLESLAERARRRGAWDSKNGFLSVPSEDLPKLREVLSGINISGTDIKCMIEENELLFRDGVPLNYIEGYSGVSIIEAGKRKIVVGSSLGELERIIIDAREKVREDVSVLEDKIPSDLREYVKKTLDDSRRGELWKDPNLRTSKGSPLKYSLLFMKYLLSDEIERGLASEGINYTLKVHGSGELTLPWKYVTVVCSTKGWDLVHHEEVYTSDELKVGRVLFPERVVKTHYERSEHIHAFLLRGPGVKSMDELRKEIGDRLIEKRESVKGIVREECHTRLHDYFCNSIDLREISKRTRFGYYSVADSVVKGMIILTLEGILDGIVSPVTKEKLRAQHSNLVESEPHIPNMVPNTLGRIREKRIDDERERRMRMNHIGKEHIIKALGLKKKDDSNSDNNSNNVVEPPIKIEVPSEEIKPRIVALQSPQFIQRDDHLYQRSDIVEREWQVSLIDVRTKMDVETLDEDKRYVCVSEDFLRATSRLAPLDALIVRVERALPRRTSQLLRKHFWEGVALFEIEDQGVSNRGIINENVYSSLLQEVEEGVYLSRCIGRNLSPQFLRRRLFEGRMEFIPLYKLYSVFGIPSPIIVERFGDRVFSFGGERGVVASNSHKELFEKVVLEMRMGIKQYAGLLPQACRNVLDAVFNPSGNFDSEIETCSHITSNRRELAVEVITGYDMIKHSFRLSKSTTGIPTDSYYSKLRDVSAEYHVRQNMIRRLKDVDVFDAGGISYIRMNPIMKEVLERLSKKKQNDDVEGIKEA